MDSKEEKRISIIPGKPTITELAELIKAHGLEAAARQLNVSPRLLEDVRKRYGIAPTPEEKVEFDYEEKGLIRDVWYGQRTLGETWWIWNVLVGIVLRFLDLLLIELGNPTLYYLFAALTIPYSVWIIVGAWRSASNNPGFWAGVVKVVLVIQIPLYIIGFIAMFFLSFEELTGLG